MPPKPVIMGLYARLQFLLAHFLTTFEKAFLTSYFESQSHIFGPNTPEIQAKYVAYQCQEYTTPLPQVINALETQQFLKQYHDTLHQIGKLPPKDH